MGIIQNTNVDETTAVVDLGLDAPIAVWIKKPVEIVKAQLRSDAFVVADSPFGEVHVYRDTVKFLQVGRREFNPPASNRPDGSAYV
jgi:hypothetical protein